MDGLEGSQQWTGPTGLGAAAVRGRSAGACTERSRAVNLSTGLFDVPPGADLGVKPHICLQHGAPPSINHLLRICQRTVAASEDGVTLNLKESMAQKTSEHNVSSVRLHPLEGGGSFNHQSGDL